jgi:hypothetical protein
MSRWLFVAACVAVILLFSTLNSSAAIITRDFLAPGDNLLTYDTENRREWLDIFATYGVSVDALEVLLSHDALLHRFRLASLQDVESLALSAGFDRIATSFEVVQDFDVAYEFIDHLSGVRLEGGVLTKAWYTTGIISDGLSSVSFQHVSVIAEPGPTPPPALNPPLYSGPTGGIWTARGQFRNYPTNPAFGYWLYRDAAVPEPTMRVLVLTAALTGFGGIRRWAFYRVDWHAGAFRAAHHCPCIGCQ